MTIINIELVSYLKAYFANFIINIEFNFSYFLEIEILDKNLIK